MAFLFWLFSKARKPFFFVCYGSLYVISKTERDIIGRIEKVILYYLAKYYILLEHLLYITWAFLICYLGKYYYWGVTGSHYRREYHAFSACGVAEIYEMCCGAGVADKRKKSAVPFVELRL